MECKLTYERLKHIADHELIDTLWNVNYKFFIVEVEGTAELIDTLWNVNI